MYTLEVSTRQHYHPNTHIWIRVKIRGMHTLVPEINYDIETTKTMIRGSDGRINRRVINEHVDAIVKHYMDNYLYIIRTRVPGFDEVRRAAWPINQVNPEALLGLNAAQGFNVWLENEP